MTKWLFPTHRITDDSGTRVRVTGRLPFETESISLSSFNPYRSEDPFLKKAASLTVALIMLAGLIIVFEHFAAMTRNAGCWAVPIFIVIFFSLFHLFRIVTGSRGDEELLQKGISSYREEHPNQCPACDGKLQPIENALACCIECGACWNEFITDPEPDEDL